MGEDVDEVAVGVAHEEASYAPGLVGRTIFDGNAGMADPLQRFVEIVDLDR